MKKFIFLLIIAAVILSCVLLVGCTCGGSAATLPSSQTVTTPANKTTTPPAQTAAQQQKPTGTTTTPAQQASGSSGSWGIPIYPGAKETLKLSSDKNESLNNKPAVAESRMYTTSDKRDKVVAFYDDKMPASGWKETLRTDMGAAGTGTSLRQYDKNNGQEFASIQCSDIKDGTMIKLDWKYPK